jgi:16S rRNA (guanine1207-N2)-methyltransferase
MAEHYFSPSPGTEDRRSTLRVTLGGRDVAVQTAAGVFSAERLDLGSRVLLREVPAPPPIGDLLDLGCGWGPLALAMGIRAPAATVWAVDVNQRALALTARNASALGLTRIRACAPDDVPGDIEFAAIWSNPPIRVGKQELHALILRWLPRLASGGQAHLVVMRNLGADSLQRWLSETLTAEFTVERVASAKGYRVLRVTRRTPEGRP